MQHNESHQTERPHRHSLHPSNKHAHHAPKKKEKCCGGHPIIHSEGELVISYKRTSFTLPYNLPFAFWGTLYIGNNSFGAVLAPYLPAGVTVTTSIDPNTGNLTFTYTNGVNTDTIVLSTPKGLISYAELLQSINTSYMKSDYSIMQVNIALGAASMINADIYTLLDQPLIPTKVSALSVTGGSKAKNIIIPRSRMTPQNTQINLVELYLRHEDIKADTVWINSFAYTATIAELGLSIENIITVFINEIFDVNKDFEKVEWQTHHH